MGPLRPAAPCPVPAALILPRTCALQVEVDMEADVLTDLTTGKKYSLKPLGDVRRGRRGGCL